eukprot:Pgem_evm1s6395
MCIVNPTSPTPIPIAQLAPELRRRQVRVHHESDINQAMRVINETSLINSTGDENGSDAEHDVMNESEKDDFEEAEIPKNDVLSSSSNVV